MEKLSTLSKDTAGKLDVLGHDGDTLGVDGTQVGVLKEADEVSLTGLLVAMKAELWNLRSEILGNLSDKTLEGELADEKLGGLLVPSDLTEGNCSRPVPVWLLDSAGGRGRLASSLGGQLLPGGLASSGLTGGLLGTGHLAIQ